MPLDTAGFAIHPANRPAHRTDPDWLQAAKRAHLRQQAGTSGSARVQAQVEVARTWEAMLEVQRNSGWL